MPSRPTGRSAPLSLAAGALPATLPWRDVVELLPDGIALTTGATHVVVCMNTRLREITAQPRERGSFRFDEVFHGIDTAILDRVYASGVSESSAPDEHRGQDGTLGSLGYTFSPLRDESGSVSGLIVSVRDATEEALVRRGLERTAASVRTVNERLVVSSVREQELAEAEAAQRALLNALLEKLSEGVVIVDTSGHVRMVNGAARDILAVGGEEPPTVEALGGLEVQDVGGQRLLREDRPVWRALRGEEFTDYEVVYLLPSSGERRRFVSTGTNVRDTRGQVALAIVVFRDVTELRRLEDQREEYTALISHDLRGPLSSVVIFSQMLKASMQKKGLLDDAALAQRLELNADRMGAMIAELTDATNLELHGTELRRAPLDLKELVIGIADRQDATRARRIDIEAEAGAPYTVSADGPRLERCIANLLTNALKYSPENSPVVLRLSHKRGSTVLDVIDRGIGIAPETVKNLFDRYYRTTSAKTKAEGLGLGLYIARLIAEAHDGRIDVVSEIGKGSTFRLILPLHGPPDARPGG